MGACKPTQAAHAFRDGWQIGASVMTQAACAFRGGWFFHCRFYLAHSQAWAVRPKEEEWNHGC